MGRTPCCEKVGLKRGRWTAEEDEILINYIKQNGEGSWRSLPKKAGLLRCGKSCRLRWINYLRTDLKRGNFSREEDETIIKLRTSVGNKWSLIASNLPGRTDNEVKNYWNSHLSRKIYRFSSCSSGSMVNNLDMVKIASKCKRKGGRVSRALAKKYNRNATISATTTTSSSSTRLKIGEISGIQEATPAENAGVGLNETTSGMPAKVYAAENAKLYDGGVGSVEESGKYQIYDEVERESLISFDDFRCDGLERCPEVLMPSPEELKGENEVLGTNEGLEDVTFLLEQLLESESMDHDKVWCRSEEKINVSMDSESALINKEIDRSGCASNSDTTDLYESFSPLNSCFNHELVNWDTEYSVPGFNQWDQGDDMLWLWQE